MKLSEARLFKLEEGNAHFQTQMTRQDPIDEIVAASGQKIDPAKADWWIEGLDPKALPLLVLLIGQVARPDFHGQNNPKSIFGAALLKSPMLRLLGKPAGKLLPGDKDRWAREVARMARVGEDSNAVAAFVMGSKGKRKNFALLRGILMEGVSDRLLRERTC